MAKELNDDIAKLKEAVSQLDATKYKAIIDQKNLEIKSKEIEKRAYEVALSNIN